MAPRKKGNKPRNPLGKSTRNPIAAEHLRPWRRREAEAGRFEDLDPDHKWCTREEDGTIEVPKVFFRGGMLSPTARLALALNETCCERGRGKVYMTIPPLKGALQQRRIDANIAFRAVPEAFYVPEIWSAEKQDSWRGMKPIDQLYRIHSRFGWVDEKTPVLPFAIELYTEEDEPAKPKLDGLIAAPLTVLITPRIHFGFTEDMRRMCGSGQWLPNTTENKTPLARVYVGKDNHWKKFARFHVGGRLELIEAFDKAYIDGDARLQQCLKFYGDLRQMMILAGKEASEHGQGYGLYGAWQGWADAAEPF